jgi:hypothetical protein
MRLGMAQMQAAAQCVNRFIGPPTTASAPGTSSTRTRSLRRICTNRYPGKSGKSSVTLDPSLHLRLDL